MVRSLILVLSCVFASTSALAIHDHDHDHEHVARNALPDTWMHTRNHPVHALFKRQSTDPAPAVGSDEWYAQYPHGKPDVSELPKAWTDAYEAAKAAGKISSIAPSKQEESGDEPTYGDLSPSSPEICSSSDQCRAEGTIWDAPAGTVAISFDDGPLPPSSKLYDFLKENNQRATHFFIGINVLNNNELFQQAFNDGQDLAVHTWTHPYMTTLSDLEVIGELGWTMQIIHDSSGGHVPRFWRPPFGDSDIRVQNIAREVFGLQTVIWNRDSSDWKIEDGDTTRSKVEAQIKKDYTNAPKSPGLMYLEHELTSTTVQIFMETYPLLAENGWKAESLATLYPELGGPYQQAGDAAPLGVFGSNETAVASPTAIAPAVPSVSAVLPAAPSSPPSTDTAAAGGAQSTTTPTQNTATGAALHISPSRTLFAIAALSLGIVSI